MKRYLFIAVALLLPLLPGNAQEDNISWPPDPSRLLAANVEVIETRLYPTEAVSKASISADDERRVIIAPSQNGQPREFPYPNTFHRVVSITVLDETTLVLLVEEESDAYYPPYALWVLK